MNSHITSTPLINSYRSASLPSSPNHSRLTPNLHSPKYLIASPTYGTPLRRQLDKTGLPFMNSTVNVSLYTNAQSPGFASRIVQYDRAQNGRSPTHNRKFGTPGIFPIVHLYKQSLPEVSPKPKKVTVKIAPPDDLSMYNNYVDHSIIMSENARITTFPEHSMNETGTRSVLDALKEISRKRIHSAAEFETSPEGSNKKRNKRILETTQILPNSSTNSLNSTPQFNNATNKRPREESPPDMNCLPQSTNINNLTSEKNNTAKRYCSIDPITASFTSANLKIQELGKGPTKKINELQEDLPGSPLRKVEHVSVQTKTVETQTLETIDPPEKQKSIQEIDSIQMGTTQLSKLTEFQETPTKVPKQVKEMPLFDPRPLEVIRRNKLATLLGAMCGQKPILEKVPAPNSADNFQRNTANSDLINSLIPNSSILSNNSAFSTGDKLQTPPKQVHFDVPISNFASSTSISTSTILAPNPNITQTTTALVMPISSTMIAPSAPIPSIGTTSFLTNPTSVVPSTNINLPSPLQFVAQNSPPKVLGGFKFDLQQSTTTPSTNVFPSSTTLANSTNFQSQPMSLLSSPVATSFIQPSTTAVPANVTLPNEIVPIGFQFDSPKPVVSNTLVNTNQPTISFGLPKPVSTQALTSTTNVAPPSFNFGATVTTTSVTTSSTFSFGSTGSTSVVSNSNNAAPTFSFATKPVEVTQATVEVSKASITTSASTLPLFGGTTFTSNMFSKPAIAASPFQTPTTSQNVGFALTTSASTKFGTTNNLFGGVTTSASSSSTTFSFGSSNTSIVPSTINSAISFGGTASMSSTDKAVVVPSFGSSNNALAVTTASTNNIFGVSQFASSTPAANLSGTTNSFGGFGTKTPIKFGETAPTTTQQVMSNQAVTTASSLFSFGGGTTAEPPKMFGNTTENNSRTSTPTFGATGAPKLTFGGFGGSTTTNSSFGGNQLSEVPPNQTVQPSQNSAFSFGGSTAFDTASTFNKPAASFESTNTFGGQQNASFNSGAPSFGTPQSKLFTFGSATATPKTDPLQVPSVEKPGGAVFAFGTPVAKPQAASGGFNFSSSSTNNSFGAPNAVPSFGASTNPAPIMFGSPQAPPNFNVGGGFNAPGLVGNPGMFSIGSGSSTGPSRPRTQLKTKRRT